MEGGGQPRRPDRNFDRAGQDPDRGTASDPLCTDEGRSIRLSTRGRSVMAADLAPGPTTGLRVQACGDCHLANFGAYATPEGTPVFDVNDFDETLPAPFEWDVKRLAVSLAVAGRVSGASDREARLLARTATKHYRRHLGQLALLSPLEAWSSRIDLAGAIAEIGSPKTRRKIEKRRAAVLRGAAEHYGLVERKNGDWKIRDKPPLVHHLSYHDLHAHQAFA